MSLVQEGVVVDLTLDDDENYINEPSTSTANFPKRDQSMTTLPIELIDKNNNTNYGNLLKLHTTDAVSNSEAFKCPMCYQIIETDKGIILKNCLHNFCKSCLVSYIEGINSNIVICPYTDNSYECNGALEDTEMKFVLGELKYSQFSMKIMKEMSLGIKNAVYCKTLNCVGWTIRELNDSPIFKCPVCMQNNCCSCGLLHDDINCPNSINANNTGTTNEMGMDKKMIHEGTSCQLSAEIKAMRYGKFDLGSVMKQKIDYMALIDIQMNKAVLNFAAFDCPICFTYIGIGEGIILKNCHHNFCNECLVHTISHNETAIVKCPFANESYSCDGEVEDSEIKFLLSEDQFEKYLSKSIKIAELQIKNTVHCLIPNCIGWAIKETDEIQIFICPVCEIINCLKCEAIHTGQSCNDFQKLKDQNPTNVDEKTSVDKLKNMLKSGEAMHCPQCQIIVTKTSGCDAITCAACKTQICWVTKRPRHGPNGCKCGVGGRKCHPNCGNCH